MLCGHNRDSVMDILPWFRFGPLGCTPTHNNQTNILTVENPQRNQLGKANSFNNTSEISRHMAVIVPCIFTLSTNDFRKHYL